MNTSYGHVTWWGFSPALDAIDMMRKHEVEMKNEVNILLVGSGDCRHILKTLASSSSSVTGSSNQTINFYVDEASLETMARQMSLLDLMTRLADSEEISVGEKAEMFLELHGNSLVRNDTDSFLRRQANELIKMITDPLHAKANYPLFDVTNLKYKERDRLEGIFKFWRHEDDFQFNICEHWEYRLRQFLGTRYDTRENHYDWDYNINLKEKASIIHWHEYKRWRETGVAFNIRDDTAYEVANRTLASGLMIKKDGQRIPKRGFWGDIVTGPYLSYGIHSSDKALFEKKNGVHTCTSTDVSYKNILSFANKYSCTWEDTDEALIISETNSNDQKIEETSCNEKIPNLEHIKVIFLPLESVRKMHTKSKFNRKFDLLFFSNSMVHLLSQPVSALFSDNNSLLVIESSKYIVDLKSEMHKEYCKKITGMAENVNCKVDRIFEAEKDDYAVFKFHGS